jgi:hypothetical protein
MALPYNGGTLFLAFSGTYSSPKLPRYIIFRINSENEDSNTDRNDHSPKQTKWSLRGPTVRLEI